MAFGARSGGDFDRRCSCRNRRGGNRYSWRGCSYGDSRARNADLAVAILDFDFGKSGVVQHLGQLAYESGVDIHAGFAGAGFTIGHGTPCVLFAPPMLPARR